jgi:hypothetical protein
MHTTLHRHCFPSSGGLSPSPFILCTRAVLRCLFVGVLVCVSRGRGLASAALNYLSGDDEELEPDASRAALILAPGQNASVLDVAVVAAQKVCVPSIHHPHQALALVQLLAACTCICRQGPWTCIAALRSLPAWACSLAVPAVSTCLQLSSCTRECGEPKCAVHGVLNCCCCCC